MELVVGGAERLAAWSILALWHRSVQSGVQTLAPCCGWSSAASWRVVQLVAPIPLWRHWPRTIWARGNVGSLLLLPGQPFLERVFAFCLWSEEAGKRSRRWRKEFLGVMRVERIQGADGVRVGNFTRGLPLQQRPWFTQHSCRTTYIVYGFVDAYDPTCYAPFK